MTLQELFEKTLQKLQMTAAGEPAEPEDTQLVGRRYASLYDMLNSEGLVSWAANGDLPDSVELPITAMLACHCAREFGVVGQAYAEILLEGGIALPQMSWAERQLRRLMARKYVPNSARPDYF